MKSQEEVGAAGCGLQLPLAARGDRSHICVRPASVLPGFCRLALAGSQAWCWEPSLVLGARLG
eukprot:105604-Chlamydomonas_euryale.AAC.9